MAKRDSPPQLARARAIFAERFETAEQKSEYYRRLGQQAAARRVVLSGEEAEALAGQAEALHGAYELLRRIAARHAGKLNPSPESPDLDVA